MSFQAILATLTLVAISITAIAGIGFGTLPPLWWRCAPSPALPSRSC